MSKLTTLKATECACAGCKRACYIPGWATPQEVKKAIENGFEDRFMLDYLVADVTVYILSPALKGLENKLAPYTRTNGKTCTFYKRGKCELHKTDFKPSECRLYNCELKEDIWNEKTLHEEIGEAWNCDLGRELVKWFRERNGFSDGDEEL